MAEHDAIARPALLRAEAGSRSGSDAYDTLGGTWIYQSRGSALYKRVYFLDARAPAPDTKRPFVEHGNPM